MRSYAHACMRITEGSGNQTSVSVEQFIYAHAHENVIYNAYQSRIRNVDDYVTRS